jgi:hypothetical protein
MGGMSINVQLAQVLELEAKLVEEYHAVRLLCASIAGEASTRGERMRELGKQARERQYRLQCRRPKHATARESKARCSGNTAPGHARALDTRSV